MPYLELTRAEKDRIIKAKSNVADLLKVVEEIVDESLNWSPGRWWSVYDRDGELWLETSDEEEARREHELKPFSTLHRQYVSEQFSKLEKVK